MQSLPRRAGQGDACPTLFWDLGTALAECKLRAGHFSVHLEHQTRQVVFSHQALRPPWGIPQCALALGGVSGTLLLWEGSHQCKQSHLLLKCTKRHREASWHILGEAGKGWKMSQPLAPAVSLHTVGLHGCSPLSGKQHVLGLCVRGCWGFP